MKSKILKYSLLSLLLIVVLICLLMATPRILSSLNPKKAPIGYHFTIPTLMTIGIGLEDIIDRVPNIPLDIEEIKNIEYKNINGISLQLDIYKPKKLNKPAPLLVFIHGGGWRSGKRSDYLIYLIDFAKRGYITATVSYRLKNSPYPAAAEDVRDAVNWFFCNGEKYGYDPDRIALIGGSAGAHLAMLTAYGWNNNGTKTDIPQNHKIKAVVDIYGPTDLTTEYARNHRLVTGFLAHSYEEEPNLYREASPINYLDAADPPTLILHGTSDTLVPISQAELLKSRLDNLNVPCVYYPMPLWPHTMDIIKRVNDYCQIKMDAFFKEYVAEQNY